MGIASGTIGVMRYRILNWESGMTLKKLNEAIEGHKAKPVDVEKAMKDTVIGWVPPLSADDDLVHGSHWDMAQGDMGHGFLLRFRIEKRRVGAALLQELMRQRLRDLEKAGERIGRKERSRLRDNLKRELTSRALPTITFADAFWLHDRPEVLLFTTSKSVSQIFEELFTKTFIDKSGAALLPLRPPFLGLNEHVWQRIEENQPDDEFTQMGLT